jgi:Flp pilus assembly protein TadG
MSRPDKQRGTAMVEFALILPVFVLLAIGGMIMLMAVYTYSDVGYIAQQVAQCRANYLMGGASSTASQCPGTGGAQTYATTLETTMFVDAFNTNPSLTVTESTGTPCAGCLQEQISYGFTPFAPLIPAFTMNQTAVAAVTMYSANPPPAVPATAINGSSCAQAAQVPIAGVTSQMVASASPQAPPDLFVTWYAFVDPAGGLVDLYLCNLTPVAVTTTPNTYNVRVIP